MHNTPLRLSEATQQFATDQLPELIDYDFLGLHKVKTFHPHGYIQSIAYYLWNADGTPNLETGLVVDEVHDYVIDPTMNVVVAKKSTQSWYDTDGEVGRQKATPEQGYRVFLPHEVIQFDDDRRAKLLQDAKAFALNYLANPAYQNPLQDAFDLLNSVAVEWNLYKEGQPYILVQTLQTIDKPYLDVETTIGELTLPKRMFIIGILNQMLIA